MEMFCFIPKEFILLFQTKKTGFLNHVHSHSLYIDWGGGRVYTVDGNDMGIYE